MIWKGWIFKSGLFCFQPVLNELFITIEFNYKLQTTQALQLLTVQLFYTPAVRHWQKIHAEIMAQGSMTQ